VTKDAGHGTPAKLCRAHANTPACSAVHVTVEER
jgi:hypothetical protein